MNSRSVLVVILIVITILLGVAAIVIGDKISRTSTAPDDASAYNNICPDGDIDPNEECETGISCAGGQTCNLTTCQCEPSGDGDGDGDGDGAPACGDGVVDAGEECNEPGLQCGTGEQCNTTDCTCAGISDGDGGPDCGDGVVDTGEQCGEPGLTCPTGQTCNTSLCTCSGVTTTPTPSVTPTLPDTALVSDEADNIIIGLVLVSVAFLLIRMGVVDVVGSRIVDAFYFHVLGTSVKNSKIVIGREKKKKLEL